MGNSPGQYLKSYNKKQRPTCHSTGRAYNNITTVSYDLSSECKAAIIEAGNKKL